MVVVFIFAVNAITVQAATVVILGDSLSDAYQMPREAGWVQRLDQRLGAGHRVVDAAISGDTTAGALSRVDTVLAQFKPDLLVVILGGNDGLRGLPPAEMETNLARIIARGQASGARVALMQIRLPPNLGPIYIERFEAVFPRLVERTDAALLPFFLDDHWHRPGMMMADGIHPSEEAQPILAERMEPMIRRLLAD